MRGRNEKWKKKMMNRCRITVSSKGSDANMHVLRRVMVIVMLSVMLVLVPY